MAQALIDIGPDNHPDRIIYILDLLVNKRNYTEVLKLDEEYQIFYFESSIKHSILLS